MSDHDSSPKHPTGRTAPGTYEVDDTDDAVEPLDTSVPGTYAPTDGSEEPGTYAPEPEPEPEPGTYAPEPEGDDLR